MKQNNIFKPTLKFSEKTSVSNVNVSNDNFRLSEAGTQCCNGRDGTRIW